MSTYETPKFESFETSSTESRRMVDRAFYVLCIAISVLSVVILVILLTTIAISAIPAFGPHSDHFESNNRFVVVQGENEGNDPDRIDAGDLVQGIFHIEALRRGGLGKSNDIEFETEENKIQKIGIYSFKVGKKIRENELETLLELKPTDQSDSVTGLLNLTGIQTETIQDSSIAIISSETAEFDFDNLSFADSFVRDAKILDQISGAGNWNVDLVIGFENEVDFCELKLQTPSSAEDRPPTDSMASINSVRRNKKGGQLNCILSIVGGSENQNFEPLRVRSLETNELVTSQAKIDSDYLTGLSRRQKKGFHFGGELGLVYCPIPETDVTTVGHVGHFLQETPKSEPASAGIGPAMAGSLWVIAFCALFALPIGVGTAIFLEEFKPTNKFLLFLHSLIQLNITNLAGVPSIVYGILGLTAFATMTWLFGSSGPYNDKNPYFSVGAAHYYQYLTEGQNPVLIPVSDPANPPELVDGMKAESTDGKPLELNIIDEDEDYPEDDELLARSILYDSEGGPISRKQWYYLQLPFGRGVLAASLTLMLVILPVIIIATQEALRAVPSSLREGALGLGSTQWQVVRKVTLPAAIPSIMTGAILSMSRAIGEAAPILILCGIVFITSGPQHLMDEYSVLPIQIYYWTKEPIDRAALINFQNVSAAGIVVLLAILLTFNAVAILIRQYTQKPLT